MNKVILSAALSAAISATALAQSGTNSPYSQYDLGLLSANGSGFNRGMNGLGLGFHSHNQVNYMNPASYSSLDSLSFIFDAGLSGQITNFQENSVRKNAKNGVFDYVVAGFRIAKHVGVSFGVLPYSTIGYNYSSTKNLNDRDAFPSTEVGTSTYEGKGGLHQVFLGAGWEPMKGLAIGANIGYLWGNYNRSIVTSFSNGTNSLSRYYKATINNYKLDIGAQYTVKVSQKNELSLGITYGYGHRLGANPQCEVISSDRQTGVADTTLYEISNGLSIPTSYGAGLMFNHNNKLKIGFDYSLMQYAKLGYPKLNINNNILQYGLVDGVYNDRQKFTAGVEFCPNDAGRKLTERIRYRIGASYATSYYKVNGIDGPKEYSVSAGFGIPVVNEWNNRSVLNISGSWVHQEVKGLIKENTFRINIGFTFNERWFAKWKVD